MHRTYSKHIDLFYALRAYTVLFVSISSLRGRDDYTRAFHPVTSLKREKISSWASFRNNCNYTSSRPGISSYCMAQVPHQNHQPLHISKRQLIDEGRLLTDATTPNSAYVPGNTQREPLIIEDDSDDKSDNEAEVGVASSDLLASIRDQDASDNGLASQDTALTLSSLFGPSTPRDSEYFNAGCFSRDGQQRLSFAELDSTFPVHGVEKAIVDEIRPSPLRERDGRLCNYGSICDIKDELQQTSTEAGGPLPSSAAHSQYDRMDQESQDNTNVRGASSEERLWEQTIEQQHCQQKEQEDELEDNTEATSGEDKGPISYCQQIKDNPQHQRLEDEIIVEAPLSQVRKNSVKSYHRESEDEEDEEDGDMQPPRRRKRRRIDSDATETATRKKVHTRPSCTTRGSTVSRNSLADAEPIIGADYQEYPLQGFLKCVRIGRETTYNLEFRLLDLPDSFRPSIGLHISNSTSSGELVGGLAQSQVCASHAKRSQPALQKQRKRGRLQYTEQEDNLLMRLKKKGLP
ncbi:hypothetical protein V490_00093 [Pseudogymnoascus sp. VKM F-3557]|nr:hypothetical protein V490_00093 [Pseudogymnoascus sp. VKM F-3557]